MKLAVLGGGHGAVCMAADLTLAGHEVRLHLRNRDRFAELFAGAAVELEGAGRTGSAAITLVTDDVPEAIAGARVILVPLPAYAHEAMAAALAPYVRLDQLVYLTPGTFGAYVFARAIGRHAYTAEAATLPYGTRLTGPASASVTTVAEHLPTGVFPARRTEEAIQLLRQVYPAVEPSRDVLDAALLNVNGALHASLTIMNAGPIEALDVYDIHREGSTSAILRVMAAMERERIALREALGYGPPHWSIMDYYDHQEWLYGVRGRQMVEQHSVWREKVPLTGRYIEEDVRFGLSLWSSLGRSYGVPTPLADAFIQIAGAMNGRDYVASGLTLEKLDLEHLSVVQLKERLRGGID